MESRDAVSNRRSRHYQGKERHNVAKRHAGFGTVGRGVISYQLGGKQNVVTTSGIVSRFFGGSGTSAVIIFSLP